MQLEKEPRPIKRAADPSSTDQLKISPRLLTRPQAASYLALTAAAFDDWVRRGLIPGPLPGTRRWDRHGIDAAIDRASGLQLTAETTPLDQWRNTRDSRPA
jgi:hypothetical protein